MKKFMFAIFVLLAILVAGVLETVYIHKLFTELDQKLCEVELLIVQESPDALEKTQATISWWEGQRKYLELFTFSPDIRGFSVAAAEAEGSLMCKDFLSALSKCKSLIIMAKNLHQMLDFNIEDII